MIVLSCGLKFWESGILLQPLRLVGSSVLIRHVATRVENISVQVLFASSRPFRIPRRELSSFASGHRPCLKLAGEDTLTPHYEGP